MKNKSILSLIELTVMLAVFALAAALCLQAFVQADQLSRRGEAKDRAVAEAQNVAEILQQYAGDIAKLAERYGGTLTDGGWRKGYDPTWTPVEENEVWRMTVKRFKTGGGAEICVTNAADDTVLVSFPVGWQEVTP